MNEARAGIPYIDPNVQYVGVSKLRTLNATNLNELDKTLVIQDNDRPLAVVLSYEQFLEMQRDRERILATLSLVFDQEENNELLASLQDVLNKRVKPLSAVREALKKKKG
jgi:hypothetical protein